jgi:drug/metabolite transporter (DMT)-like permease
MSVADGATARRATRTAERRRRVALGAALLLIGAGWGLTMPLTKIAVSEGYRHVGIVFWQLALGAAILGAVTRARGKGLPLHRAARVRYLVIALVGTLLPGVATFEAARHLPSGWLSVVLSMVPLFAFPMALALGIDRFGWARLAGLALGLAGVVLLAAPAAPLAAGAAVAVAWLPLALVAPALYGLEGNLVARYGLAGLDPVQLLFGASAAGAAMALGLALATGTFIDPRPPWGAPDGAIVAASAIHAVVYTAYVWLVGRAGAVFAAQVSYLVTGFGVLFAMLLLGESYGTRFWLAVALMFAGLFLVQPRRPEAGAAPP